MTLATDPAERYATPVSDEPRDDAAEPAVTDREPSPLDGGAADGGPVDQLGIPMSREPTLDDVRGDGVEHRRLAVGCTLAVIALLAAFYALRVLAMR